jgi:transcriptional regulator with XRE-family HTH domain
MREQARMTLDESARRLEKTRSSLHRIEQGQTKADIHLVKSMMDLYDIYDEELGELVRQAAKSGWWRAYGLADHGYVSVETEASRVLEFQLINIPGLLQVEAYIRPHLDAWYLPRTPAEIDNVVAARLRRQERLFHEERPLQLHAVIDESALRRQVGGHEVMHEQLRHLVAMSAAPTVLLQVLPLTAGSHSAMDGAFNVLTFPDLDEPDLLYMEYPTGAIHVEAEEEVRRARLVFERLIALALPPAESVALIERVIEELYDS